MLADLRYSLRNFRKSPGFLTIAILVLALGIGANTAIFSVVNASLLHALSFPDAGRLVMVWEKNPQLTDMLAERVPTCLKNFFAWKTQSKSFESMGIYEPVNFHLTGGDKPEQVEGAKTSWNLPDVLGVHPAIGRMFTEDECKPGNDRVAVISHAIFEKRFGGRDVLGSMIRLGGDEYKIIGVWGPDFRMPSLWGGMDQKKPAIWTPLDMRTDQPDSQWLNRDKFVYARLKPGVSLDQTRAEMTVIGKQQEQAFPNVNKGFNVNVFSLASEDVGSDMRRYILLLQGAVGFVLLIACANVANLMLARAIGRRKELAVRLALGATRWRLMRQMFAESMLLSITAGATGILLAYWGLAVIGALAPPDLSHLHDLKLDPYTLAFTLGVALLTGIIFGLAPAFDAGRRNVNDALTQGGRSGSSSGISARYRGALVAGEVALALMLLVGAGLLIRTVRAMLTADQGFQRDHLLTLQINLPDTKYAKPEQAAAFCRDLLDRVGSLPGVSSASLASGLPMQNLQEQSYKIVGAPEPPVAPMTNVRTVDENYFRTMAIPVVRGRGFTRAETETLKPALIVINQAMAKTAWPGQDPLGHVLKLHDQDQTVIGVVANAQQLGPDKPVDPEVYFPSRSFTTMTVVARSAQDPTRLANPISQQIWAIDKDQPISEIRTMDESLGEWTAGNRFVMVLMAAFAVLALVLAAAGIYGVLAYSVSQRTREIGIRMAIGATAGDVLKMVVREGLILTVIGLAIGLTGAFALTRLLQGLIFGVSATDAVTYAGGVAVLAIASLAASWLPARRAARLQPLIALRDE